MSWKDHAGFSSTELAQQYYENERQVIKTGESVLDKEEMVIHHDTGKCHWHLTSKVPLKDSQGQVTSIISISTDITDRKHSEEALQNERNLLRTVIDNLPDMIFFKDTEGRYFWTIFRTCVRLVQRVRESYNRENHI